jgi:hypothetical protein
LNGPRLLTPDAELPEVPAAPAPWRLEGDGWILLLRLTAEALHDPRHLPVELSECKLGGPAVLMFVDYARSPAGPYRELLYMPGRFALPGGSKAWSVTRIYVSTWDSVVNGRRNWGIPKDLAQFRRMPGGSGERIEVEAQGRSVATLELEARGPALPLSANLLPAALRRLVQYHGGQRFELAPGGAGRGRMGRAVALDSDPELFPDLAAASVLGCFQVPRFTLDFPVAKIEPQSGHA